MFIYAYIAPKYIILRFIIDLISQIRIRLNIIHNFFNMQPAKPKILFPTDFSESSLRAWKTAELFSKAYDAEIVILSVLEAPTFRIDYDEEFHVIKLRKYMNDQIAEHGMSNEGRITTMVKTGKPFKKIVEAALEIDPILIIMGTHGASGMRELFVGSNASNIIREAPCPVVTVRENILDEKIDKILLPLDMTKETREKVAKAIELATRFNAEIQLVSVIGANMVTKKETLEKQLDNVAQYIKNQYIGVTYSMIESEKSVGPAVLEYAATSGADIVCIMTQQEKALSEYFVGSTAEHFVNNSVLPVLSIRPSNLFVAKRLGSIFQG